MSSIVLVALVVLSAAGPRSGGATAAQEVYKPGQGVTMPVLLREVKPQYPASARSDGKEGIVTLECVVTVEGTVGEVRVKQALDPALDEAAIEALRQWRFKPGTKDGKPVPVLVEVEMSFALRDLGPRLDSAEVYRPGIGVTAPRLVADAEAAYTDDAVRERVQGTVLIECVVRTDGTVGHMRVKQPLHPQLDASALKAVGKYRFAAGTRGGYPVPVQVTIEVVFRIQ